MINITYAIAISILWVYVIIGLILAKYLADEEVLYKVIMGTARQKIGWIVGNLIVVVFWPVLVSIGIIKGITDIFR